MTAVLGTRLHQVVVATATGLLCLAVLARLGLTAPLPAYLYLAVIAVALTMHDLSSHTLPNAIVLPSYVVSGVLLLYATACGGQWWPAVRALLAMAALWLLYYAVAMLYPGGMGFGDVKLAGLLGMNLGWLGWNSVLVGAFGGFLLGALAGVALLVTGRASRRTSIAFGPFMLAGAFVAFFAGGPISDWYRSLYAVTA